MNAPKKSLFAVLDLANAFAALHHSDPGYAQMKADVRSATRDAMAELNSGDGLGDLLTHRSAWRDALVIARDTARDTAREKSLPADVDHDHSNHSFGSLLVQSNSDSTYWEHELQAFDRTFDLIGQRQGVPTAIDPFADVRDKRMSELTPEQQDLAMELWVRTQIDFFSFEPRDRLEALLRVIDRQRGRPEQFPAQDSAVAKLPRQRG